VGSASIFAQMDPLGNGRLAATPLRYPQEGQSRQGADGARVAGDGVVQTMGCHR
jgi:hypothetical protein